MGFAIKDILERIRRLEGRFPKNDQTSVYEGHVHKGLGTGTGTTSPTIDHQHSESGDGGSTLKGLDLLSVEMNVSSVLTGSVNNYNAGVATIVHQFESDGAYDITGIVKYDDTVIGSSQVLIVHNVSAFTLTLKNESASSTAANRFAFGSDLALPPDRMAFLWYDTASGATRWRTLAVGSGAGSGNAPDTADYLVGTAQAGLSAEIVVGTTPGGELGGTWASPTVDATHSGTAHHAKAHAAEHGWNAADVLYVEDIGSAAAVNLVPQSDGLGALVMDLVDHNDLQNVPTATTTITGHVELATTAETTAGTHTSRVPPVSALPVQVQDNKWTYWADTGVADAYVITPVPTEGAITAGQMWHFKATNLNTGASTLKVGAQAVTAIKKLHDQALVAGDIEAGQIVTVVYDGTNFQMQSQLGQAAPGGGGAVATDVIWDTKGDLAVATGADAAIKLAAGSDNGVLQTLASEATGLIWRTTPRIGAVADTSGNTRLTLAAASPHLVVTGDIQGSGNLSLRGAAYSAQIFLDIGSETFSHSSGVLNALAINVVSHMTASTLTFTAIRGAPGIQMDAGLTGGKCYGLDFRTSVQFLGTGATCAEIYDLLVRAGKVSSGSTYTATVTEMGAIQIEAPTRVGGGTPVTTVANGYAIKIEGGALSSSQLVFTNFNALRIEDFTGTTYPGAGLLSRLLEVGTSTPTTTSGLFRVLANFTAAANRTPIYVSEGATPTVRQLRTFDPGNLGVNFTAGQLVCVLV